MSVECQGPPNLTTSRPPKVIALSTVAAHRISTVQFAPQAHRARLVGSRQLGSGPEPCSVHSATGCAAVQSPVRSCHHAARSNGHGASEWVTKPPPAKPSPHPTVQGRQWEHGTEPSTGSTRVGRGNKSTRAVVTCHEGRELPTNTKPPIRPTSAAASSSAFDARYRRREDIARCASRCALGLLLIAPRHIDEPAT